MPDEGIWCKNERKMRNDARQAYREKLKEFGAEAIKTQEA